MPIAAGICANSSQPDRSRVCRETKLRRAVGRAASISMNLSAYRVFSIAPEALDEAIRILCFPSAGGIRRFRTVAIGNKAPKWISSAPVQLIPGCRCTAAASTADCKLLQTRRRFPWSDGSASSTIWMRMSLGRCSIV